MNARLLARSRTPAVVAFALATALATPVWADDSSSTTFTTLTAGDNTASVSVPTGWKLIKSGNGFIGLSGPNKERVSLGVIALGKSGATAPEIATSLPFSATRKDKLTSIIQGSAAKHGMAVPQITYASETQMRLSVCSRFLGGWTAGSDDEKFEAIMCSLPPDFLGFYKNITFLANVPASRAAQDRPIVEKIAGSYRVKPAMFKRMVAPYTAPPPLGGGGGTLVPGPLPGQDFGECFDYNVIRESPPWEVPAKCGGHQGE